jgi:hypothetical protein
VRLCFARLVGSVVRVLYRNGLARYINRGDGTCLGVNSDYVLDAIERGDAYITTIRVLDTDKPPQK